MVMRKGLLLFIFIFLVFSAPASAIAPQDELAWEQIVPGIEYQKFVLPDPNNVFVARMDRINNPNLTLESTLGQGKLTYGRETVSGMFARYDQALNNWGGGINQSGWGMRNQAVVAINGAGFDWYRGGPRGGHIQSGWYAQRYDVPCGGSGFGWRLDRSTFIGGFVKLRPEKQLVTYLASGITQEIDHINTTRDENELVLFTPQYDSRTGTNNSGVEVEIEMDRPTMILPYSSNAAGTVRQIYDEGNNSIRFNSIVLSASGTASDTLMSNIQVGSRVGISQEITSLKSDCITPDPLSWTKTYTSIASDYDFLKDGQIVDYLNDPNATVRNPRTAIAYNDQYIFFVVVDGRDTDLSIGMSIHQLAVFVKDTLGATWGVAQDGGGSSTMVINGQVVNNVHCNNSYVCITADLTYLPIVNHKSQYGQPGENVVLVAPASDERAVANGMMMTLALPGVYSAAFAPGDAVSTLVATDVRLGPGTNYASITTLPVGTHGSILEQMNGLDGVMAKSSYWWYVNFGTVTGWVPESTLVKSIAGNK